MLSPLTYSGTFYFANANSDWTAPANDALWQDRLKTLFDPCPPGWRVPKSGVDDLNPWRYFSTANSLWNGNDPGRNFDATAIHGTSTVWYPATGYRDNRNRGLMNAMNEYEHVWSTSHSPEVYFILRFNSLAVDDGSPFRLLAIGFSVRCIRE